MTTISERIDKAVRCTATELVEAPPAPNAVKIELVRSCNFQCAFCHHSKLATTVGNMELALYARIVDEMKSIGVRELAPFFYGESFLSPALHRAIKYAHDTGFANIFLTTNGSLATPDRVEACMAAGLKSLKFSLNYADQPQFMVKTGREESLFRIILSNVKAARFIRDTGRYDCSLSASYILYDEHQQERIKPLLEEMRPYLDDIYALPMYGMPTGSFTTPGNTGRASNPVAAIPCWVLFRAAHINYDGTVCACSFNVGEQFTMGDLKKQSFMEIWHGEKFRALRRAHLKNGVAGTACESCLIAKT